MVDISYQLQFILANFLLRVHFFKWNLRYYEMLNLHISGRFSFSYERDMVYVGAENKKSKK